MAWRKSFLIVLCATGLSLAAMALTSCQFASAGFLNYEDSFLNIDDYSERTEILPVQREVNRIEFRSSNPELLKDARLFKHLKHITLESRNNFSALKALAETHPDLDSLTIVQPQCLEASEVELLKSFKKLQFLRIECDVCDCSQTGVRLPSHLRILQIRSMFRFAPLAELVNLVILQGDVNAASLRDLRAPNLELLDLQKTSFGIDGLPCLNKFHKLNALFLSADFKSIRSDIAKYTKANLYISGEPYPSFEKQPILLGPLR